MIRNLLLYGLLCLMVLPGCKRGDDDPFFSLRSRKNRLTGDWVVSSYELTRTFGDTVAITYDGAGKMTYTLDTVDVTTEISWSWKFDRQGEYSMDYEESYSLSSYVIPPDSLIPYTQNTLSRGNWEFTGGNDSPAKSQLLLELEEMETTRTDRGANIILFTLANPKQGSLFSIDRLTKDEIVLSTNQVRSYPFYEEVETEKIVLKPVD